MTFPLEFTSSAAARFDVTKPTPGVNFSLSVAPPDIVSVEFAKDTFGSSASVPLRRSIPPVNVCAPVSVSVALPSFTSLPAPARPFAIVTS